MICKQCGKRFKAPDKKTKIRYAYYKFCSKHCDYEARKRMEPKKNKTIAGAHVYEDIICNPQLRAEQKLAMTVIKQAKIDIEGLAPQWQKGLSQDNRMALASALKFMFLDRQSLTFWCTIAGWSAEAVQEQCYKLVKDVEWKPMLETHRRWILPNKQIVEKKIDVNPMKGGVS